MKIQKSKTPPKKILFTALAVILVCGGLLAYYFLVVRADNQSKSPGYPAESDKRQAEELAKNPDNKSTPVNTDSQEPLTPDNANTKITIPMVASVSTSQGSLYIRGGLNNAVVSTGDCFAMLEGPGGQSIRKDSVLLQNASTTDCKTIIVNTSELSPGRWSIKLQYSSDDAEGASDEVEVNI